MCQCVSMTLLWYKSGLIHLKNCLIRASKHFNYILELFLSLGISSFLLLYLDFCAILGGCGNTALVGHPLQVIIIRRHLTIILLGKKQFEWEEVGGAFRWSSVPHNMFITSTTCVVKHDGRQRHPITLKVLLSALPLQNLQAELHSGDFLSPKSKLDQLCHRFEVDLSFHQEYLIS